LRGDYLKKKLLNAQLYAPACSLCEYGRPSPDATTVLCVKRGIMLPGSSCKKFKYDPIKRQPLTARKLPAYAPEDFKL